MIYIAIQSIHYKLNQNTLTLSVKIANPLRLNRREVTRNFDWAIKKTDLIDVSPNQLCLSTIKIT